MVLLTNDITLTIKAMAVGLICEIAKDFRESLINPFSKRFLWADSCPRGLTWCALDEAAAMRKNYCYHLHTVRTTPEAGMIPKGLKLILLHNFPQYQLRAYYSSLINTYPGKKWHC